MTDYQRRKLKMQNDPLYAKMYKERDALYQRERRKRLRDAGVKTDRYIPSVRLGYRVSAGVREEAVRRGYMRYLKSIGKMPQGTLAQK